MIKVSELYKEEMNKPIRNNAYVSISLGVVNQSAQQDATIDNELFYFSRGNVFDNLTGLITYATFEQNYIKADGEMLFPPEDNEYAQFERNGITIPNIGGSLEISLGQAYTIKGLTIDFGNAYPTRFSVQSDDGIEIYDNAESIFVTEDTFEMITFLRITPINMTGGQQRLHIRNILLGVGMTFSNADTQDVSIEEFVSGISAESSYSTYRINVFDENGKFDVDNDESFMSYLEPLQPVNVSFGVRLDNDTQEWLQVAKAYLKEWSVRKNVLTIVATDRMSQLENEYENNVLESRTAQTEFESILTDAGLEADEYSIDDYFSSVYVLNPMPKGTYRECLQLLANATRGIVYEDENGILRIIPNFQFTINPDSFNIASSPMTEWGNIEHLIRGAEATYADFSADAIQANGERYFLPENAEYLNTGFVSNVLADSNGEFTQNPYVEIELPVKSTYYNINIDFGAPNIQTVQIITYYNGVVVDTFTHDADDETIVKGNNTFADNYEDFDTIRVEVTKATPNSRVVINRVSFGTPSDYNLRTDLMYEKPYCYKEQKVRNVRVKIYSYELNEDSEPELIDDDVYYEYAINETGVDKTVENPLIDSQAKAELLAEWIATYYKNNVSYTVSYRGDPRLQAKDVITMDSLYRNNLQVEIEKSQLTFNGAFKGNLELRRALNMA